MCHKHSVPNPKPSSSVCSLPLPVLCSTTTPLSHASAAGLHLHSPLTIQVPVVHSSPLSTLPPYPNTLSAAQAKAETIEHKSEHATPPLHTLVSSQNPEWKPDFCKTMGICSGHCLPPQAATPIHSLSGFLPSHMTFAWLIPFSDSCPLLCLMKPSSLFPGIFSEIMHPNFFPTFIPLTLSSVSPPVLSFLAYQDPGYYHRVNLSLLPQRCKLLGRTFISLVHSFVCSENCSPYLLTEPPPPPPPRQLFPPQPSELDTSQQSLFWHF